MGVKIVSPKAELAVLRGMVHKNKIIAGKLLASVDETYFASKESVEIYKAIRNQMTLTGESPPYRLIIEDPDLSEDSREFFRDSQATIQTREDVDKAVKILNRYRQRRGLYDIALAINDALQGSQAIDMPSFLDNLGAQMAGVRTSKSNKNNFLHFGVGSNSKEMVETLLNGKPNEDVIPTGIPAFDQESGGLVRGSLFTLGATSGGGKSMVASKIAREVAKRGFKVVIVPLEMSKVEMTSRFLAAEASVDVTRILQKRLSDAERALVQAKYEKWSRLLRRRGGKLTVYKPTEDVSIDDVFAAVSTYDADVVIIDYISLLAGTDGDDSWQQLGAIARKAKINAEATNRANVLLCQVSEDGKIRYARSISEHSTNSWVWNAPKEEREKPIGRIKINQPKARNSRSFPFEVGFSWQYMDIVRVDDASPDVGDVTEPMKNLTSDLD